MMCCEFHAGQAAARADLKGDVIDIVKDIRDELQRLKSCRMNLPDAATVMYELLQKLEAL